LGDEFGPFAVSPAQLTGLSGGLFQELISRLLAAEAAAAGLSGVVLHTSYQANVGDKGVDALVETAAQTVWIPEGDSAWQFKAGDLGPESCAAELDGATFAHEILNKGGAYRLVLGKAMEPYLVSDREKLLREKAGSLGYNATDDRIIVVDGNQLARWVEKYPSLAVSRLLKGIGQSAAIDFASWTNKQPHQSSLWIPSPPRDDLRNTVLTFLGQSERLDLRIEGASGVGKTRGVLESLRGSKYEQLILYVGSGDDFNASTIHHLLVQDRSADLVIDDCLRQRHKVFAEQLEPGRPVRLITIGDSDTTFVHARPIGLNGLSEKVIDEVLTKNRPLLWSEARRLVVEYCNNNVGWALYLAQGILDNPTSNVGDLINEAGLRDLIINMLGVDGDFLAFSALALFSRYGLDGERHEELELIAAGLGLPLDDLEAASLKLEERGLLTKYGRYRAVSPQPLAVLLATHAWDNLGDRILDSLLPRVDARMAERIFLRAADTGSSGPAAIALNRILGTEGPFRSLGAMAHETTSRLLIQLAIISPKEVAAHLSALIDEASNEDLYELKGIRRNLIWTLEKIVWHSSTFEVAADILLRLALAENETFGNNATGTWIGLFGSLLPSTAARPVDRLSYLQRQASDDSSAVRMLAVRAAGKALDVHESTMVSGELQGGVIVEPRGTPPTYADLWSYIESQIELLRVRAIEDEEAEIRVAASEALIAAIHPFLENEVCRGALFDALADLPIEMRRTVWTAIRHLEALFDQVSSPEFAAATGSSHDVSPRRAGLALLIERLPRLDDLDDLKSLAASRRWEFPDGELEKHLIALARSLPVDQVVSTALELLSGTRPAEASYELGAVLHAVASGNRTLRTLAGVAEAGNIAGIVGYLYASIRAGDDGSFDTFLDGEYGVDLDPAMRLTITVRGPQSETGWRRLLDLEQDLPVSIGAPRLFGWHVDVDERKLQTLLANWLQRIATQDDYNAAVDVVAMMTYRRTDLSAETEALIWTLVQLRPEFKDLGRQEHDWTVLASRGLRTNAESLLLSLMQQIDAGSLDTFSGSEEQRLLEAAVKAAGPSCVDQVLSAVQESSWRLQLNARGWLADALPTTNVIDWVGDDPARAQVVASLVAVGNGMPSPLVQFLLSTFEDDGVAGALHAGFLTGSWTGNESGRIYRQIEQLETWTSDRNLQSGVKRWARSVIGQLKERLAAVLQEEAERER
jgi:hypothetical protein